MTNLPSHQDSSRYHLTQFKVWKKSMDLATGVHEASKDFPKTELFAMTDQMRRASRSVSANIAEGFRRFSTADKKHKYVQARGELVEVISFLHLATQIRYLNKAKSDHLLQIADEIYRMLNTLIVKMINREP